MYCRCCQYDLRGLVEPRCPECGRAFSPLDPQSYYARRPHLGERIWAYLRPAGPWMVIPGCMLYFVVLTAFPPALGPRRSFCAAELGVISRSLVTFQAERGRYPEDLSELSALGYLMPNRNRYSKHLYRRQRPSSVDVHYVRNLNKDDPANWIILFETPRQHRQRQGLVVYLDYRLKWLSKKEFFTELKRFKRDYRKVRGEDPVILLQ